MDLEGKSIIVTGATSGIGRATAVKLAYCGAQLTLVGRNPDRGAQIDREVQALGANACLELVDLTQPEAQFAPKSTRSVFAGHSPTPAAPAHAARNLKPH